MNTYLTTAALVIVLVTLNCASGAPGGSRSFSSSSHLDIDAMIDPLQPSSAEDPKESQLAQRSLFNFRVFCKEGEQHVNGRCVPVFKSSGAGGGSEAAALQLAHSFYQRNKTTRKPSRRRPQGTGEISTTTTATTTDPTTPTTTIPPTTTLTPEIHTAPTMPGHGSHYQIVTSASSNSFNSVTAGFAAAPSTPEVHELDIVQTTLPAGAIEEHVHHHHSSHRNCHHQHLSILTSPTLNFETTTSKPKANPTSWPTSMRLLEEVPATTSTLARIQDADSEDQVPETTVMPPMSDTEVFPTDFEVPNTSLSSDRGPNMASTLPPGVVQQIQEETAEELHLAEGAIMSQFVLSWAEATGDTTEVESSVTVPLPQRETSEAQTLEQQPQTNQPTTKPPPASPTTQVFHVFPEATSEPPVSAPAAEEYIKASLTFAEKLSSSTEATVTLPTPTPSFTTTTTRKPSTQSTSTSSVFRFPEEESGDYIDEPSTELHSNPAFQPTPFSATSALLASIFLEPIEVDQVFVPKPRSEFRAPTSPQGYFLKPSSGHIRFNTDIRGRPEVLRSLAPAPAPSQFLQAAAVRRKQLLGGLASKLSDYPTYPAFTEHEHFRFPFSTISNVASEGPFRAESERRSRQHVRQFG